MVTGDGKPTWQQCGDRCPLEGGTVVMSTVSVPVMTSATFVQTEREIGEVWKQQLQETMAEAGREEKRQTMTRSSSCSICACQEGCS